MPRQTDRTREFFAFSKGTPATATTPVVKPHWSCINRSDGGISCDYKIIGAAFKAPLARAHLSGSGKHCRPLARPLVRAFFVEAGRFALAVFRVFDRPPNLVVLRALVNDSR